MVLPGWTLVETCLPEWILDASKGCTIVIELLSPEVTTGDDEYADWRAYVLSDGKVLLGDVRQVMSESPKRGDTDYGNKLLAVLTNPRARRWSCNTDRRFDALLLMCGEANLVRSGSCRGLRPNFEAAGVGWEVLSPTRLIVNAAHYRSQSSLVQTAMEDKRSWLSRGRVVVSTSNLRVPRTTVEASHRAAAIWCNDARLTPVDQEATSADFCLSVYRVSLPLSAQAEAGNT